MPKEHSTCISDLFTSKGPVYQVQLTMHHQGEDLNGHVVVSKVGEPFWNAPNYLRIKPEDMPKLIRDLEWAYNHWRERDRTDLE